ncbi:DUF11 domain-containing protein [Thermoactinospora rubra]|uniref:DUF11 domain-containing protein n=1 Tax=Thermoactinospora rubra TaxID=1088767 RepID=UPI000A0F6570|nr:DUF11 domain-containing protein [Thermoactinospora rubra]
MRKTIGALVGAALAAAPVALAAPAAATPQTTQTAAVVAKPFSNFKISVKATKATKRGGKITYRIRATNKGPYEADYYWIGGILPTGVKNRLYWWGPKGTKCEWERRQFWCWGPYALEVGKTDWLDIQVTLEKGTKGTATAKLGVIAYDMPTGADQLSMDELERIGIDGWQWLKTAKTKIVWPKPNRPYVPPPVDTYVPPKQPPKQQTNSKKDT